MRSLKQYKIYYSNSTLYLRLFKAPSELPPRRECDHKIPLIQGATPVHARPYCYAPALKDEIDK
jgi:hypothetical protein